MYERFTNIARNVMHLANEEALRLCHEWVGTEHILLGLVKEGTGVASNLLQNHSIDLRKIRRETEKIVQRGLFETTLGQLPQTPRAKRVVEYAIDEAYNLNHNYVGTEHLLLGILRENEGVASQILINLGLRLDVVRIEVLSLLGASTSHEGVETQHKPKIPTLSSVDRDLTELARHGKLDPLIGRDAQLQALAEVLGCRKRNSAVLLGEAGAGRSSIVAGLARAIAARTIPDWLEGCRVIELSFIRLLSGGRDEAARLDVLKAVLGQVARAKNVILFLPDELRSLSASPSGPFQDALRAEFLDALRGGELRCILSGTPAVYEDCLRRLIPFDRYFQPVPVPPATVEETRAILGGVRDQYEKHHLVRITDEALATVAELADRHLSGALPGKALLLLDHAGARGRGKGADATREARDSIARLAAQIERLNREKETAIAQHSFDHAAQMRDQAIRLQKERDALVNEENRIRQTHGGTIEAADVADTLTQLTIDAPSRDESSFIAPVGGPEN